MDHFRALILAPPLSINQDDHFERKFQRILDAKFPDKPFEVNVFLKTCKYTDLDEEAVVRDADNFLAYYKQNIVNEEDIWNRWRQNCPEEAGVCDDGEDCYEDV